MKKKYFKTTIFVILGVFIGLLVYPLISGDNVYDQIKKYEYVFGTAIKEYVEEVDAGTLTESAIKGLLNDLDPHSTYINVEDMKRVDEDMQGSFEGIGVEFDVVKDTLTVITPLKDGPSEKLGILSGDKIIKVDGENVIGISRERVPKLLRGDKGTKVTLHIKREGAKNLLVYEIIRDKIPQYSVDAYFIYDNSDIGIIQVNRFSQTTHTELMQAARELQKQGMKKLILDLRGNPGGYLDQAFLMADEFLARDTIVYTKARREYNNQVFTARSGNSLENIPLIVLINAESASASEIVSGAIQDMDRGLIVGTTSFGKGTVQRQFKLSDGSAMRLTIAKYYTPSGRCIQRSYKDKNDYRRLVGRLELEEGANLEHALDLIKKEEANKKANKKKGDKNDDNNINLDSIELFYTRSGRVVLGGGGITPDYVVKNNDTVTDLTMNLLRKDIFRLFINADLKAGKDIKEYYNGDFKKFSKEFKLTDDYYKKLRATAEEEGIEWDEEQANIDKEYFEIRIKSMLARTLWDRNRGQQIWSQAPWDRQLKKATELFPVAEKIRLNNKNIRDNKK